MNEQSLRIYARGCGEAPQVCLFNVAISKKLCYVSSKQVVQRLIKPRFFGAAFYVFYCNVFTFF